MSYTERNYDDFTTTSTLSGLVNSSATSLSLSAPMVIPPVPFEAVLGYQNVGVNTNWELILVTAVSGLNWTITRAYDNTNAATHGAGAVVAVVTSAIDLIAMNGHTTGQGPEHLQYLDAAGSRHDLPGLHIAGQNLPVSVPTSPLYLGQSADIGPTGPYAASGHVHTAESAETLGQGLYLSGALALWPGVSDFPSGWMPADGRGICVTDYPLTFEQIGYTFGGAVGWYPPAPLVTTTTTYTTEGNPSPGSDGIYFEPLQLYVYETTPDSIENLAIEAPPDALWYCKLPQSYPKPGQPSNEPLTSLRAAWDNLYTTDSIPPLLWVMKVDRGVEWVPRSSAPAPVQMSYYPTPPGTSSDHPKKPSETPSPFWWAFDATTGIPMIYRGDDNGSPIGPLNPVLVFPYGTPQPSGTTLVSYE